MITKIKKLIDNSWQLFVLRRSPVIVYTPGRVGSMSLILALQKVKVFSFKAEFLNLESLGSVWFCKHFIIKPQKPAKIITLVRDPIEILCSLFFSTVGRNRLSLTSEEAANADNATLQKVFLEEIIDGDYFDRYLRWFETEFEKHLHFNIFDFPFDTDKKYSQVQHDKYPTLILRTELPNSEKEAAVKTFLNIPELEIENLNVKADRKNGPRYQSFKDSLTIPRAKLEEIYSLNYSKHFFSPAEIAQSIERWSK